MTPISGRLIIPTEAVANHFAGLIRELKYGTPTIVVADESGDGMRLTSISERSDEIFAYQLIYILIMKEKRGKKI